MQSCPAACMPVQLPLHASRLRRVLEPSGDFVDIGKRIVMSEPHLQVERTVSMRRAVGPGRQVEQHHLQRQLLNPHMR